MWLKKYYPDVQILAHTRSRHTTEYALEHGIIDEICDTVDERYRKCDYIFLCAPVECNASYLGLLKPYLKKGCILTDVGSTKTNIHKKVEELGTPPVVDLGCSVGIVPPCGLTVDV